MRYSDEPTSPQDPQIFRQNDDGTGKPRHYYIGRMKAWSEANLRLDSVKPDGERALILIEDGTVDLDHVFKHTLKIPYSPIIICLRAGVDGHNLIVDGNHRYVAFYHLALQENKDMLMPAYCLEPEEWEQFVVPKHIVLQLGLKTPDKA